MIRCPSPQSLDRHVEAGDGVPDSVLAPQGLADSDRQGRRRRGHRHGRRRRPARLHGHARAARACVASVVTNPDATTPPTPTVTAPTSRASSPATAPAAAATIRSPAIRRHRPGRELIAIKASDDAGRGTILDAIYGLQFVVDHKADYNIRVVNLSVSSTTPSPIGSTRWTPPWSRRTSTASSSSPPSATAAPPRTPSPTPRQRPVRALCRRRRRPEHAGA